MTPVRSFRISFLGALKYFTAHNPGARILVGSIPNIPRLRRVLERVPQARAVWDVYGICQSTLAGANTPAQRRRVAMQERAYNETLAGVCRQFTQCRWDGGAVYAFKFSADDVSSVDYFHPSRRGQNHLASITWQAGYWPEEP